MKRILFNADVVIDVLLKQEPHWTVSALALDTVMHPGITGYLSGHSLVGIYQSLSSLLGTEATRKVLRSLLQPIEVVPTTKEIIQIALLDPTLKFEDALLQAVAHRIQAYGIITRQPGDLTQSLIPIFTPVRWIKLLGDPNYLSKTEESGSL